MNKLVDRELAFFVLVQDIEQILSRSSLEKTLTFAILQLDSSLQFSSILADLKLSENKRILACERETRVDWQSREQFKRLAEIHAGLLNQSVRFSHFLSRFQV